MKKSILLIYFLTCLNFISNAEDNTIEISFNAEGKIQMPLSTYVAPNISQINVIVDSSFVNNNSIAEIKKAFPFFNSDISLEAKIKNLFTYDKIKSYNKVIDLNISSNRVFQYCFDSSFNNYTYYTKNNNLLSTYGTLSVYEINQQPIRSITTAIAPSEKINLQKNNIKNKVVKDIYTTLYKEKYQAINDSFNITKLLQIKNEMQEIYQELQTTTTNDTLIIDDNLLIKILQYNLDNSNLFIAAKNYINVNKDWIIGTTFINEIPTLNPLGFVDESIITNKTKPLENEMNIRKKENEMLEKFYANIQDISAENIDDIYSNFKTEYAENVSIINKLTDEINTLTKQKEENEKIKKTWSVQKISLNEVALFPSKIKATATYMRHHDATKGISSMDNNNLPVTSNLYETNELVKILLHNIEAAKYNPYFEKNIIPINDTALFTELVYPTMHNFLSEYTSFGGKYDGTNKKGNNQENFINDTKKIIQKLLADNIQTYQSTITQYNVINIFRNNTDNNRNPIELVTLNEIKKIFINIFIDNYATISWLATQTEPLPYPEQENTEPIYQTIVNEAIPEEKRSYKINYNLGIVSKNNSKDTTKMEFGYRVFKKQYIQFMAMAAFFPTAKNTIWDNKVNQRNVVSYDADKNTFTTTTYKPYDIVFGAKIYPLGMNIRSWLPKSALGKNKAYKSILKQRGDLIRNRFSILVGLSVSQKQLRNYFTGLGYEIVPGCGINTGLNFYSTPYYRVEQNQLIATKEHFKVACFLGFSFDPIVLIQAISLGKL